jgi:ATP-binding cassette subfamily F protein 3
MQRVSTAVIEVRESRVASYPGSYEDYVYRVHKELEAGLRAEHATYNAGASKKPAGSTDGVVPSATMSGAPRKKLSGREERELEKRLKSLERRIAKLDEEKRDLNAKLLEVTDNAEAKRVRQRIAAVSDEVAALEHEWLESSGDL